MNHHPAAAFVLALFACLCGCGTATIGGARGFATANDELRARVATLESQNRLLTAQRDELAAKLAEEQRVREGVVGRDVLAAIPRCAGIEIDSLSGVAPADPEAPVSGFILYIRTLDGERRFVQAVGTLRVEVLQLDEPVRGEPARVVASAVVGPADLRSAYRSGFGGTHYSVELPAPASADERGRPYMIRARFEDALTGVAHDASHQTSPRRSR
ncbi:MAG: hypothetical protein KF787_10910 [Phycisphaeraceae bacterium]|nr:hypothetical protein [Phycisphaerae bacterium]MBX3393145.1 hypothetical protein [Phycisphaeraceae bacterium]HRJ49289.1 hypothetical protein [Phycisphaerales bacterium]